MPWTPVWGHAPTVRAALRPTLVVDAVWTRSKWRLVTHCSAGARSSSQAMRPETTGAYEIREDIITSAEACSVRYQSPSTGPQMAKPQKPMRSVRGQLYPSLSGDIMSNLRCAVSGSAG